MYICLIYNNILHIQICCTNAYRSRDVVGRVFANCQGNGGSIPG